MASSSVTMAPDEWRVFLGKWGGSGAKNGESSAEALLRAQSESDAIAAANATAALTALQPSHNSRTVSYSVLSPPRITAAAAAAAILPVSERLLSNKFFLAAASEAPDSLLRGLTSSAETNHVESASYREVTAPNLLAVGGTGSARDPNTETERRQHDNDIMTQTTDTDASSLLLPSSSSRPTELTLNAPSFHFANTESGRRLFIKGSLPLLPAPATTRALPTVPSMPLDDDGTFVNTRIIRGKSVPVYLTAYRGIPEDLLIDTSLSPSKKEPVRRQQRQQQRKRIDESAAAAADENDDDNNGAAILPILPSTNAVELLRQVVGSYVEERSPRGGSSARQHRSPPLLASPINSHSTRSLRSSLDHRSVSPVRRHNIIMRSNTSTTKTMSSSAVLRMTIPPTDTANLELSKELATLREATLLEQTAVAAAAEAKRRTIFAAHAAYRAYTARLVPRSVTTSMNDENDNSGKHSIPLAVSSNATFTILKEVVSGYTNSSSTKPASDISPQPPLSKLRTITSSSTVFPSPRPLPPLSPSLSKYGGGRMVDAAQDEQAISTSNLSFGSPRGRTLGRSIDYYSPSIFGATNAIPRTTPVPMYHVEDTQPMIMTSPTPATTFASAASPPPPPPPLPHKTSSYVKLAAARARSMSNTGRVQPGGGGGRGEGGSRVIDDMSHGRVRHEAVASSQHKFGQLKSSLIAALPSQDVHVRGLTTYLARVERAAALRSAAVAPRPPPRAPSIVTPFELQTEERGRAAALRARTGESLLAQRAASTPRRRSSSSTYHVTRLPLDPSVTSSSSPPPTSTTASEFPFALALGETVWLRGLRDVAAVAQSPRETRSSSASAAPRPYAAATAATAAATTTPNNNVGVSAPSPRRASSTSLAHLSLPSLASTTTTKTDSSQLVSVTVLRANMEPLPTPTLIINNTQKVRGSALGAVEAGAACAVAEAASEAASAAHLAIDIWKLDPSEMTMAEPLRVRTVLPPARKPSSQPLFSPPPGTGV